MTERKTFGPGVLGAWGVGLRMLSRYTGLFALLYAIQLAVSAGAALIMGRQLTALFSHRPLFDAAVSGDLAALITAFYAHPYLGTALLWIGLGAAFFYAVLSWFTTGGLIDVFLKRPVGRSEVAERFGRGGGLALLPYLRLFLYSLLPYGVCLIVLGAGLALAGPDPDHALTVWELAGPLVAGATPGAILFWIAGTAVDYARIDLLRYRGMPAWRALLRAYRLLFSRLGPLSHASLYPLFFVAASAGYVAITSGAYAGIGGGLWLIALRQGLSILRFAARYALVGGQVELAQYLASPPRSR